MLLAVAVLHKTKRACALFHQPVVSVSLQNIYARGASECVTANPCYSISAASSRVAMEMASIDEVLLYKDPDSLKAHVDRAWEHWRSIGSPQYHVAPMVDQSELPFRMLCRTHGATAAYTPMLHARLFVENSSYRAEHFTTCPGDRPLFVQFCANDPTTLVEAAKLVQAQADYIDLNLGCPQRIAKRGNYGAFLMDDLPRVAALVAAAAGGLTTPISCKVRLFPQLEHSIAYARMLQAAGCSLLAVHGRTREQKDTTLHRADWAAIAAVRAAVDIPVLANGDMTSTTDAAALMAATKAQGVMSAEPLLVNPALYSGGAALAEVPPGQRGVLLAQQYLELVAAYPTHLRMVKGHLHKLLGGWLAEFVDLRDELNRANRDLAGLQQLVAELAGRVAAAGRDTPVPVLSERKQRRLEAEAAWAAAVAEQEREAAALAALRATAAAGEQQQQLQQTKAQQHQQPEKQLAAQQQQQQHCGTQEACEQQLHQQPGAEEGLRPDHPLKRGPQEVEDDGAAQQSKQQRVAVCV